MIIIGYPGIGKSTLAATDARYIDLESSCFTVDGKKLVDWHVAYCQVAEHLSRQGYIVFVSSHADVVGYFSKKTSSEFIAIIYPSVNLRNPWVYKLQDRFEESGSEKDERAWMRSAWYFKDDVRALAAAPILSYKLPLTDMEYDLKDEIEKILDGRL